MKIIGNPQKNNIKNRNNILNKLEFKKEKKDDFYQIMEDSLSINKVGLDIGKGLRERFNLIQDKLARLDSLDINIFSDYPDIQMDLCSPIDELLKFQYDLVFCFSVLEHCYDPKEACLNLEKMIGNSGIIFGYVPFLYQFHCPSDLSYQDYYRFTPHALTALFPNASKIYIFPVRGKLGAAFNIISSRYKFILEDKLGIITNILNRFFVMTKPEQASGFNFIIFY